MALEHDDYDDEYADEIEDLDDIDVDFVEDPIDPATYTMPQTEHLLREAVAVIEAAPGRYVKAKA